MAQTFYQIGTRVRVNASFRDDSDVLTDPTTVVAKYREPDGTEVTVDSGDILHPSTGIYSFDIDPDAAGTWDYRFEGTGALKAASESGFVVAVSRFG